MEQSIADRGIGEELIDTKVGAVHSTNKDLRPSMSLLCDMALMLLNRRQNFNL